MKQTSTRALVETAFLIAIIIMFALIGTNVPMLGMFATILVPATITIIGIRWGLFYSLAAIVVELFILSMVVGPMVGTMEALTFSSVGVVLGYGYEKSWGTAKLLLLPSLYFVGSIVVLLVIGSYLFNINMAQGFINGYESAQSMIQAMADKGIYTAEQVATTEQLVSNMVNILWRTMVLMLCMVGVCITFCASKIATLILGRIGYVVPAFRPCREWRMPKSSIYVLLLGIIIQAWSTVRPMEILFWLGPNLYLLGATLCALQGFSCIWSILQSYGMGVKARASISILAFLFLSTYLIFLGIFDLFFDLRTRIDNRRRR